MEWRLRRVVPAATVTTHAKRYAQQQLTRDLEVDYENVLAFLVNFCSTKGDIFVPGTYTNFLRSGESDTRTVVQAWSGFSAAWCPQRQSRLMPSRTRSSNLHVI